MEPNELVASHNRSTGRSVHVLALGEVFDLAVTSPMTKSCRRRCSPTVRQQRPSNTFSQSQIADGGSRPDNHRSERIEPFCSTDAVHISRIFLTVVEYSVCYCYDAGTWCDNQVTLWFSALCHRLAPVVACRINLIHAFLRLIQCISTSRSSTERTRKLR